MAKVVGLVGAASGKIGNVVYAVTNGIQVARVYQPQVYNPKSALQSMQRAKGNLAGRTSSYVPRTAILGLGANNRMRRGVFLRNMLKQAVVTETTEGYKAAVASQDVLFSLGSVPPSVYGAQINAYTSVVSISLLGANDTQMEPETYAAMQSRLVCMVYDSTTKNLIEVVTKIAAKPAMGERLVTSLLVAHPEGYIVDCYLVPMSTADGSAVSIDSGLADKDDDAIAAMLSINSNAVAFDYGRSVFLGTGTFTPSQAKEQNSENEPKKNTKK